MIKNKLVLIMLLLLSFITPCQAEPMKNSHSLTESLILSKFESFTVYAVSLAGLLDGINPCAFTTIVFFISFLALSGYKRREMIFAGTFFTLAVFIAYILIGLGIFRFLRTLNQFHYIEVAVDILIGGIAFLLGILSIIDYARFKKTKDAKSVILKLPDTLKHKIHSIIGYDFRKGKSDRVILFKIAWIGFTAGLIVSILESLCTGQVYIPTIAFVLKMPDKGMHALGYLLVYNLAFIVPLVIVFLLGLFGMTSQSFARFMERHLGVVKLSTAILFFVLGSILILFR